MAKKKPTTYTRQQITQAHLVARQNWLNAETVTVQQIQGAYASATASMAERVTKAGAGTVTAAHLAAVQTNLQTTEGAMNQQVLDFLRRGVLLSGEAAAIPEQAAAIPLQAAFGDGPVQTAIANRNERATLAFLTRTGKDGLQISDNVWKTSKLWRTAVQQVVQDSVVSGRSAKETADLLQSAVAPGAQTSQRLETARRLGISPNTSYPAMRLARTEVNSAFHEASIATHAQNPFYLGILWRISGSHPKPDECNEYADHIDQQYPDQGKGFWRAGTEPTRPHVQCLCVALPIFENSGDALARLQAWGTDKTSDPAIEDYYQGTMLPLLTGTVEAPGPAVSTTLQWQQGAQVLAYWLGAPVPAYVQGMMADGTYQVMLGGPFSGTLVNRAYDDLDEYTDTTQVPDAPPKFQVGDRVYFQTDLTNQGTITSIKWESLDGAWSYAVTKDQPGSASAAVWYPGSVLTKLPPPPPGAFKIGDLVHYTGKAYADIVGLTGTVNDTQYDWGTKDKSHAWQYLVGFATKTAGETDELWLFESDMAPGEAPEPEPSWKLGDRVVPSDKSLGYSQAKGALGVISAIDSMPSGSIMYKVDWDESAAQVALADWFYANELSTAPAGSPPAPPKIVAAFKVGDKVQLAQAGANKGALGTVSAVDDKALPISYTVTWTEPYFADKLGHLAGMWFEDELAPNGTLPYPAIPAKFKVGDYVSKSGDEFSPIWRVVQVGQTWQVAGTFDAELAYIPEGQTLSYGLGDLIYDQPDASYSLAPAPPTTPALALFSKGQVVSPKNQPTSYLVIKDVLPAGAAPPQYVVAPYMGGASAQTTTMQEADLQDAVSPTDPGGRPFSIGDIVESISHPATYTVVSVSTNLNLNTWVIGCQTIPASQYTEIFYPNEIKLIVGAVNIQQHFAVGDVVHAVGYGAPLDGSTGTVEAYDASPTAAQPYQVKWNDPNFGVYLGAWQPSAHLEAGPGPPPAPLPFGVGTLVQDDAGLIYQVIGWSPQIAGAIAVTNTGPQGSPTLGSVLDLAPYVLKAYTPSAQSAGPPGVTTTGAVVNWGGNQYQVTGVTAGGMLQAVCIAVGNPAEATMIGKTVTLDPNQVTLVTTAIASPSTPPASSVPQFKVGDYVLDKGTDPAAPQKEIFQVTAVTPSAPKPYTIAIAQAIGGGEPVGTEFPSHGTELVLYTGPKPGAAPSFAVGQYVKATSIGTGFDGLAANTIYQVTSIGADKIGLMWMWPEGVSNKSWTTTWGTPDSIEPSTPPPNAAVQTATLPGGWMIGDVVKFKSDPEPPPLVYKVHGATPGNAAAGIVDLEVVWAAPGEAGQPGDLHTGYAQDLTITSIPAPTGPAFKVGDLVVPVAEKADGSDGFVAKILALDPPPSTSADIQVVAAPSNISIAVGITNPGIPLANLKHYTGPPISGAPPSYQVGDLVVASNEPSDGSGGFVYKIASISGGVYLIETVKAPNAAGLGSTYNSPASDIKPYTGPPLVTAATFNVGDLVQVQNNAMAGCVLQVKQLDATTAKCQFVVAPGQYSGLLGNEATWPLVGLEPYTGGPIAPVFNIGDIVESIYVPGTVMEIVDEVTNGNFDCKILQLGSTAQYGSVGTVLPSVAPSALKPYTGPPIAAPVVWHAGDLVTIEGIGDSIVFKVEGPHPGQPAGTWDLQCVQSTNPSFSVGDPTYIPGEHLQAYTGTLTQAPLQQFPVGSYVTVESVPDEIWQVTGQSSTQTTALLLKAVWVGPNADHGASVGEEMDATVNVVKHSPPPPNAGATAAFPVGSYVTASTGQTIWQVEGPGVAPNTLSVVSVWNPPSIAYPTGVHQDFNVGLLHASGPPPPAVVQVGDTVYLTKDLPSGAPAGTACTVTHVTNPTTGTIEATVPGVGVGQVLFQSLWTKTPPPGAAAPSFHVGDLVKSPEAGTAALQVQAIVAGGVGLDCTVVWSPTASLIGTSITVPASTASLLNAPAPVTPGGPPAPPPSTPGLHKGDTVYYIGQPMQFGTGDWLDPGAQGTVDYIYTSGNVDVLWAPPNPHTVFAVSPSDLSTTPPAGTASQPQNLSGAIQQGDWVTYSGASHGTGAGAHKGDSGQVITTKQYPVPKVKVIWQSDGSSSGWLNASSLVKIAGPQAAGAGTFTPTPTPPTPPPTTGGAPTTPGGYVPAFTPGYPTKVVTSVTSSTAGTSSAPSVPTSVKMQAKAGTAFAGAVYNVHDPSALTSTATLVTSPSGNPGYNKAVTVTLADLEPWAAPAAAPAPPSSLGPNDYTTMGPAAPVMVPPPANLGPPPGTDLKAYTTKLDQAEIKEIGKATTHPEKLRVYDGPDGNLWMFRQGEDHEGLLEAGLHQIGVAVGLPSVGSDTYLVTNSEGKKGSVQRMYGRANTGERTMPLLSETDASGRWDPTRAKASEVAQLQRHAAFDWLIGNHDTHAKQFVSVKGDDTLYAIDKGQAFKFYGRDKLTRDYDPNGNLGFNGGSVYNQLHQAYAKQKAIPGFADLSQRSAASEALRKDLQRIQDMPDDEFMANLRPFAEAAAKAGKLGTARVPSDSSAKSQADFAGDVNGFLAEAVRRKHNLVQDFTEFHRQLGRERYATFAPPPPEAAVSNLRGIQAPASGYDPVAPGARKFASNSSGSQWGIAHWSGAGTQSQVRSAVSNYQGAGYTSMNGALRGTQRASSSTADAIVQVDKAMAYQEVPEDIIVTRQDGGGQWQAYGLDPSNTVGQVLQQDGYWSTSMNKSGAAVGGSGVVLHMRVPKGTPAVHVRSVTGNDVGGETELLLGRGLRAVVTQVRQEGSGYGGHTHVYLEVLPPEFQERDLPVLG